MRGVLVVAALVVAGWLGLHATVWSHADAAEGPAFISDGPVVAYASTPSQHLLAGVHGRLELDHGCLTMHGALVAWPYGSRWDATSRSVTFDGDFAGAAPARVGHAFRGGGGLLLPTSDRRAWLAADGREPLRTCLERTGARHVVQVYPSRP